MPDFNLRHILDVVEAVSSAKYRSLRTSLTGTAKPRFELGREIPIQTFYSGKLFDPLGMRAGLTPIAGIPTYGLPSSVSDLSDLQVFNKSIVFRVNEELSYFGDCINVVHTPEEVPLDAGFPPFGWSGVSLTNGYLITFSQLAGEIEVLFSANDNSFTSINLTHSSNGLVGSDGILKAPDGYGLSVAKNRIMDATPNSHGRMNLKNGCIYDFHYNVIFSNSAIDALCAANPGLRPPPLLFPGLPHAGHVMGWFRRDDAQHELTLTVVALQFLPLGPTVEGAPLRMPASSSRESFEASNSALHPFVSLTASAELPRSQTRLLRSKPMPRESYRTERLFNRGREAASLTEFENTTVNLKCVPGSTDFGDDFMIDSDDLGGGALARSPLFGTVEIQFGQEIAGKIPFTTKLGCPAGLSSKFRKLLKLLPPGTEAGLVGMHGLLRFPKRTYSQRDLSLTTDPYKVSVGVADVRTGEFRNVVLRKFLFQSVMKRLLIVEPRTPTDSFCYVCNGAFQSFDGALTLDLYGDFSIPYPEGYAFPLPKGGKTIIGPNSELCPFVNIQAIQENRFRMSQEEFAFRGRKHKRGLFASGLNFNIHPARREVVIFCGEKIEAADRGDLANFRSAMFLGTKILEVEFSMKNRLRASEYCYSVIVIRQGLVNVFIASEYENFDAWVEGETVEV